MKDRAAALRYARALESALDDEADFSKTADDLAVVAEIMAGDASIATALVSPGVNLAHKQALIETLEAAAHLSKPSAGFLRLLAERGALQLVPEAAAAFARIRDRRIGILEAEVTTASPIDPEMAEKARQALEKKTGRKIRLALKTDPALIGGMVAKVGSTVYDGSVLAQLAALRGQIARS